tara:strand:+ start:443 stop:733 length:291 start_codon:yes stop_codon:yes gene_type:complete
LLNFNKKGKIKMNELIKKDIQINNLKTEFMLDIRDYLINKGINKDDIYFCSFEYWLDIATDENWTNWAILEDLKEMVFKSVFIDDSSDKSTLIRLK